MGSVKTDWQPTVLLSLGKRGWVARKAMVKRVRPTFPKSSCPVEARRLRGEGEKGVSSSLWGWGVQEDTYPYVMDVIRLRIDF